MAMLKRQFAKDIAKRAGVSTSTVSRVLNREPNVSVKTRELVLRVACELNFTPKVNTSNNCIAIAANCNSSWELSDYQICMISDISATLFEKGFSTEIIPLSEQQLLAANSFRGLIILRGGEMKPYDEVIKNLSVPILTVNNEYETIPSVSSDHYQGMMLAVDYAISMGHKKIGCILAYPETNWGASERKKAFIETLNKNSIDYNPAWIQGTENILESVIKLTNHGVSLIIYGHEDNQNQLQYSLWLMKIRVPEDISIICYENRLESKFMLPPYTSINQQIKNIGRLAADRICRLSDDTDECLCHMRTENVLIKRESVARSEL